MPWSDNQNSGGPWGQRPPPRGPRPSGGGDGPNIEDLFRRGRERFGRGGGAAPKLGPGAVALMVLVLILGWLATGVYQVEPGERGIEQRFGRFTVETTEGLNYHLPWPIERVTLLKVDLEQRVDVGVNSDAESLMLTADENIVDFSFRVTWVIEDPAAFLFNMESPGDSVKPVAESVVREIIGRSTLEFAQTSGRAAIAAETQNLMQETLNAYGAGIRITRVEVQNAKPPRAVEDAFRDVQAAGQDAVKAQNEAQQYANRVVPAARGEAAKITAAADAYREQVVAEAAGQAERFRLIFQEYDKAKDVTRRRMYLETMERVLADMEKVVIDPSAGGGVVPYLPLPELRSKDGRGVPPQPPRDGQGG